MADIQSYINNILNAVYGEEVRSSLVNALEKINADNEKYLAIKQEVVEAKDTVVDQIMAFDAKHDKALQTIADLLKVASDAAVMQGKLQAATNMAEREKGELDEAVNAATAKIADIIKAQDALDVAISTAEQTKEDLAASNIEGTQTKIDLDAAIKAANLVAEELRKTLEGIDTTAEEQLAAIQRTGTAEAQKVTDAGAAQAEAITSTGAMQIQNVRTVGAEEIEKVQQAAAGIVADRQQIQQNKDDTAKLKEDVADKLDKQQGIENKGKVLVVGEDGNVMPGEVTGGSGDGIAIINTMSGASPLVIQDSAERVNKGFGLIGNTEQSQDPPPSPDNPQEIKNVGKWNEEKQKHEVDVKVTGKNLFDEEKARNVENWVTAGSVTGYVQFPVYVGKGSDIVFSRKMEVIIDHDVYVSLSKSRDGTNDGWIYRPNQAAGGTNTYKLTATEDYVYIRCYSKGVSKMVDIVQEIQLEIGSSQTPYQPYKEQTLTLTSDRPITKWDKLVEQDGQIGWLYGSGNIVFDGSEDELWTVNDSIGENGFSIRYSNSKYNTILCDRLLRFSGNFNVLPYGSIKETSHVIGLRISDVKTVTELRSWLSENILNVWHEIDAQEFIPLQQSEQDAIRALTTYYPTTVITAGGGEVDPFIEVTYTADTKNYIDQKISAINKAIINTQKALL